MIDSEADKLLMKLQKIIDDDFYRLDKEIDDALKSRKLSKDKKGILTMVKGLTMIDRANSKQTLSNASLLENIEKRLINLERIIQGITEKVDVDLSNIKSQIDALSKTVKRPVFDHIDAFISDYEEMKKKRDKWLRDNR